MMRSTWLADLWPHFSLSKLYKLRISPQLPFVTRQTDFNWFRLAGNHSLGNHLGTLLRDAEQKVRDLSTPQQQLDAMQQQQQQQSGVTQFNSRASFTNIIGRWWWPVVVVLMSCLTVRNDDN